LIHLCFRLFAFGLIRTSAIKELLVQLIKGFTEFADRFVANIDISIFYLGYATSAEFSFLDDKFLCISVFTFKESDNFKEIAIDFFLFYYNLPSFTLKEVKIYHILPRFTSCFENCLYICTQESNKLTRAQK
jgi:hypothetical protein